MPRPPRPYTLTPELVSRNAGGPVVCLDAGAIGRSYRVRPERPGAHLVARVEHADISPPGAPSDPSEVEPVPSLMRVEIRGPIEQRAGYHDLCGGWSDGYDAITERMSAALDAGDVLLMVDSPGGAAMGIAECVRRIQEAKVRTGRRITGYVDCAGSAAYWIAAAICDELFVQVQGMAGSIGARSAWCGVAGALAKEGVEVVHFAFPPGKVALAPETPLSETGRSRAQRDVMDVFEMFAGAVSTARGLSRDEIIELDADCLTGSAAFEAGLVDGVESLEVVTEYALALASGQESMMEKKQAGEAEMPDDEREKAEGDVPDEEAEDEKKDPKAQEEEEEDEEEAPESVPPSARSSAASPSASYASLAGVPEGSSDLTIRTALVHRVSVYQHAVKLTGEHAPGKITGALDAIAADAKESARLRTERDDARKLSLAAERMELLRQLHAARIHTRGELFVDVVEGNPPKRVGMKPARLFGPGPEGRSIENLRGYVKAKIPKDADTDLASRRETPFQPAAKTLEEAKREQGMSAAAIEEAKKHPAVIAAASRPGAQPIDKIARAHVAAFGGAS
jgi:ClpP class serine protease